MVAPNLSFSDVWNILVVVVGAITAWLAMTIESRVSKAVNSVEHEMMRRLEERDEDARLNQEKMLVKLEEREENARSNQSKMLDKLEERDEAARQSEERMIRKMDELRREFSQGFVSSQVEVERQKVTSMAISRLDAEVIDIKKELSLNRNRIHDIGTDYMTSVTGVITKHGDQLMDKARRIASIEQKLHEMERSIRETCDDLKDIKRRVDDDRRRG